MGASDEEADSIEEPFFATSRGKGMNKMGKRDEVATKEFSRLSLQEGNVSMNHGSYWSPRSSTHDDQLAAGSSNIASSGKFSIGGGSSFNPAMEASRALAVMQNNTNDGANGLDIEVNNGDHDFRKSRQYKYQQKNPHSFHEQNQRGQIAREEVDLVEDEEDEEDDEVDSSDISASDEDGNWISWFCSLRGNEYFCEVDEDYIQDDFNLTGLNSVVPYYEYALDMVLDVEMPMEDQLTEEQQEIVESAAEMLYGLIHARYIVTNRGMHAMFDKYRSAHFGRCPHVFCQGQPVLPVGLSDLPRNYTVNVFCPRCHGLFFPKSTRQANIDGAYFGTTFPHLYLMTHPDMIPPKPAQNYVPRVFGFKVHSSSLYYRNHDEAQKMELRPRRKSSRQGSSRRN